MEFKHDLPNCRPGILFQAFPENIGIRCERPATRAHICSVDEVPRTQYSGRARVLLGVIGPRAARSREICGRSGRREVTSILSLARRRNSRQQFSDSERERYSRPPQHFVQARAELPLAKKTILAAAGPASSATPRAQDQKSVDRENGAGEPVTIHRRTERERLKLFALESPRPGPA